MGSLRSKVGVKSMGTIGAAPAAPRTSSPSPKPWDSDVFAPAAPAPAEKKEKKKKSPMTTRSTINRGADRQLGVLEGEGY